MKDFFSGKVVIVTGASSGIGEALSRSLDALGVRVVLASRNREKIEGLAKELKNAYAAPVDVTQEHSVKNLVDATLSHYGRIDILINNAGILMYKRMSEFTSPEIREIMEVNYFGAVSCANAVLGVMRRQKSGVIVNIASIAGRIGFPNLGYYGASKFAFVCFSETLRQEVAHEGIHVMTVCPGTVYTPMTKRIVDEARTKGKMVMPVSPEWVAKKILRAIEKNKTELYLPWPTYALYLLHFFFPKFIERLAWKFRAADPNP